MTFEIFRNGAWESLDVESYPLMTDTLDESFDTCQIVLKDNGDDEAIQPDQTIRAIEGNLHRTFVIMSDQVTVASSYPLTYRHVLTLAQAISKWKKFLIRNQVFSQPPSEFIEGKTSMGFTNGASGLTSHYDPYSQTIPFDTHMKISKVQARWGFRATYWNGSKYVSSAIQGTPKGRVVLEAKNGLVVELGKFPELIEGISNGVWGDVDMGRFGWKIQNLAKFGAVKIIYESGYQYGDQDFSSVVVDGSHPINIITFTFEIRCYVHYFTMFDVLAQLRDSCAQFIGEDARKPIPFEMPAEGEFRQMLKNTIAPNFTWTQSTLYEALADFFSYYDSIMTLNEENFIGMEQMKPNGSQITSGMAGFSASSSSDERVNGMVNFYSRAKRSISIPDNKGNFMKLRAESLGVPSKGDMSIIFPDPIDHITKAEILVRKIRWETPSGGGTAWGPTFWEIESDIAIDITDRFIEQSVWNNLPKQQVTDTFRRADLYYQQTTIPFSKGSKSISLSKTFTMNNLETYFLSWTLKDAISGILGMGMNKRIDLNTGFEIYDINPPIITPENPADGRWDEVLVRVEYVAQTDGKVRTESDEYKIEREMISAQGSADCDMGKLAENMKGLIKRTGNETRSITFKVSDWDNAPKKGESIGEWVASKVDYRITSLGEYIAVVELSKDFNRLSMRTKIDRSKRLTNVSSELVQDCEDILTEYVYFSVKGTLPSTEISIDREALTEMISNTFPAGQHTGKTIDIATVSSYDANGESIIADLYIPMRKYDFGNCICFEMRYDSPMSAGNRMTYAESGWFGYTEYYSTPILYADSYGFFDKVDVKLKSAIGQWALDLPYVDSNETEDVGAISDYLYMKKPNERFGLNYEICFLSDPSSPEKSLVIGKKFFENNGLISDGRKEMMKLYYNSETPYSDDWQPDGKYVYIEVIFPTGRQDEYMVQCSIEGDHVDNWAITDNDGNIYLASNNAGDIVDGGIVFYFIPSKWRL